MEQDRKTCPQMTFNKKISNADLKHVLIQCLNHWPVTWQTKLLQLMQT